MKITIYNPDATVFQEVVLLYGSMMTNGIREDHDVTLCFSSEEELAIPEGAYVVFNGETFIAKSKSKMEMSHTRSYTYTVKMNGAPSALSSVRLRNPADGKLSFPYTASAHDHLALIVSNMNRYGGGGWSVGDCIDGGDKFLQYNYISCRDALDSLADTYGTEWEIVGKTISLHKVEYNLDSPLELSYGKGSGLRPGIIRDNVQTPMTRLYTQGGSKNIDASEYGSTILLLPKSVTFKYDGNKFEDEQGFDETKARIYSTDSEGTYIKSHKNEGRDVNEGVTDCTDIYPNKLHTVLEVESGDNPRDIVLDIDENLDYSQYQIAGEVPTITFQSGELMGKTFEIRRDQGGVIMVSKKYSEQGSFVGWKLTLSGTFESGRWLPDTQSGLVPAAGDTCRIFGVMMPSQYISNNDTKSGASWDMLRRGIMYLYEYEDYIYSLKMPVDPIWARANWSSVGSKFVAGGYVRYSNSGWAQGGVVMRIKTIRQDISKPYSIEISLSNGIVGGGVLKGLSDSISNQAGSISEQHDTQKKLEYNVSSLSGNYVTIDTEQTITAPKTFAEDVTFGAAKEDGTYAKLLIPSTSGPGIYDLYVSTEPVDGEVPSASGGIDEDELWTILGGSSTNKVIDPSHIPTIPVEKVSGLSTALSSYATKEWVEGKGYLTSVSLSTISDLHASWDSLLQSAPDFYSKGSVYSKSEADGRFVGIANEQTVTGRKTFSALLTASAGISGTNADLSGYICATKLYLPYSGGNKVYDICISTQPIDGEAPSAGGGINEDELWTILGTSGTQQIDLSRIPSIPTSKITGLDSSLSSYAKKDGSNASGTWPISISGNAASATRASYITPRQFGNQGTIGALKSSILAAMDDDSLLKHRGQSYITSGSNIATIMNNWSNDGFSIPAGSQEVFTRLDNYRSSTYGVFLVSGYSGYFYRLLRNDSSTWAGPYTLLDTGNYASTLDSRYVNVSGDTMTGKLTVDGTSIGNALDLVSENATETYLRVYMGASYKAAIGYHTTHGTYLYNRFTYTYLGLRDNGLAYRDGYVIWDAGNDGSGSGLDADLLDGQHGSYYLQNITHFKFKIGYDANVDTSNGGVLYNYSAGSSWVNAPSGMSYGIIVPIMAPSGYSIAAELAFDISHNTSTATRYMWFRGRNTSGWGTNWKKVLTDSDDIYTSGKLFVPSSEGNKKYHLRFE